MMFGNSKMTHVLMKRLTEYNFSYHFVLFDVLLSPSLIFAIPLPSLKKFHPHSKKSFKFTFGKMLEPQSWVKVLG